MFDNMPYKRTFKAKYTNDLELKAELNKTAKHSEYMPSYKWCVEGDNYSLSFKTKKEAIDFCLNKLNK